MSTVEATATILLTTEPGCNATESSRLSAADYVVFVLVLVISVAIGFVYWFKDRKEQTAENFLMADRQMSVLPVTLSLLASFMSAITLLGTPVEVYTYGTQYWMIWIGYFGMIFLTTSIFVPVFYRLHLTSVFEYLEYRFSSGLRTAGAVLYVVQMILYMGMVLYTPTLALSAVTGIDVWVAVVTIGLVCTFYTTLGGMKAVMWTDAFQIVMMFAGLIAILIRGSIDHGGFDNIFRYMSEGQRVEFFNIDPDPLNRHTFWSLTIGGCFTWLSIYGVNQAQIQRALCTPTLRQGQFAMWLNLPGLTALLTVCCLCGAVCYAEYRNCDPLLSKRITASDQLLPLYVMDSLLDFPGLTGLFVACLFSGALSTISSGLNSLAAVTLQDLVRKYWLTSMSEQKAAWISKLLAIIFGLLMVLMAYIASYMGGLLQAALSLFGVIGGPTLGVYSLGLIYPWANNKGASVGLACSLAWTIWVFVGSQIYKPRVWKPPVTIAGCPVNNCTTINFWNETTTISSMATSSIVMSTLSNNTLTSTQQSGYLSLYELSYLWYSLTAVLIAHFFGLIVSFLTGPNKPCDVDPNLLCPIVESFCCCLPYKWRKKAYCHVPFDNKEDSAQGQDVKQEMDEKQDIDRNEKQHIDRNEKQDMNKSGVKSPRDQQIINDETLLSKNEHTRPSTTNQISPRKSVSMETVL